MKRYFSLFIAFVGLSINLTAFAVNSLANYIGTGQSPRIVLELSSNGLNWKPYSIDYQGIGEIPPTWSTWNAKDMDGNYYGTITIKSDGTTSQWVTYKGGDNGRYFKNIKFKYNDGAKAYQLTVDEIHGPTLNKGPFPDAPLASPAVYSGTKNPVILSTNGRDIINNKGKTIVLKGMVRPSLEWNPQGQFLSVSDLDAMTKWHINVLRLDLNQNYWLQSKPVTETGSYKQIINALVHYAVQRHMAVILDLHWTENGHQSNMANRESINFWKQVAKDYKDFGTVIFELFNEPVGITPSVWRNGNAGFAGYQELYDAVREVGAMNLVIVNGLDYGYDLSFVNDSFKINGTNIIYGSHPYNDKGSVAGSLDKNFAGIIDKYPLIFTEFGVNQQDYFPVRYKDVYKRNIDYLNKHDGSYTAFAWWVEAKNPAFPAIIKNWSGEPLNGGYIIHSDLQDNPIKPIDNQ